MTIYFAGTERDAVEGGIAISTNGAYFDATYSSLAVSVSNVVGCGHTLPTEIGAGADIWVGFTHFAPDSFGNSNTLLVLTNASGQVVASITGTGTNSTQRFTLYNDAGGSTAIDFTWVKNARLRWDINLYTSAGTCYAKVYHNNLLALSLSLAGTTRGTKTVRLYSGGAEISGYVSEIIIADESTLGMRVKTYRPTADGTHTTWDGNYDNVNNDVIGIEAISTQLPNAAETFLHGQTLTEGTTIRALVVGLSIASANPTDASAVLNIGGTLYQKSFEKLLTQGTSPNLAIYETNPATGVSFTAADFNSLEFGVRHS